MEKIVSTFTPESIGGRAVDRARSPSNVSLVYLASEKVPLKFSIKQGGWLLCHFRQVRRLMVVCSMLSNCFSADVAKRRDSSRSSRSGERIVRSDLLLAQYPMLDRFTIRSNKEACSDWVYDDYGASSNGHEC